MDFDRELENERIKQDPMEKKVYFYCEDCGCEIYHDNEYYKNYDDEILCEDCMDKYLENIKKECKKVAGEEEL